jgi:Anti-sigma-K factor rskA
MNIHEYISSGIVELYVMGLCSDQEKKELENLRLEYPELNKAIVEFENSLEKNIGLHPVLPDAKTDNKILASLDALQANNKPLAKIRSIRTAKLFRVAAIFLFLAAGSVIFLLVKQNNKLHEQLAGSGAIHATIDKDNIDATLPESDYKIMLDPKITPVAMYGVGDYTPCRCTMFWDKKTGKMYVIIHHLPLSSEKEDYQLWGMVNNQPVSIGIIKDEIRGRFIELSNVPSGASSFIVTLEKAGGNTTPDYKETYLSGRI